MSITILSSLLIATQGWADFPIEFSAFSRSNYHARQTLFVTPKVTLENTPGVPANATGWLVGGNDLATVKSAWLREKATVARTIGFVKKENNTRLFSWTNKQSIFVPTVSTVEELIAVAHDVAPKYKEFALKVASEVPGATFTAGPNDRYLIKELGSTKRKIRLKMAESGKPMSYLVSRIGDALRSTIIVDHASQVRDIIAAMHKILSTEYPDAQIEFENKFAPSIQYKTGYVGVHSSMLFRIDSGAAMIVETQIHLKSIFDATSNCPKEYAHKFYEIQRALPASVPQKEASSSLRGLRGTVHETTQQMTRNLHAVGMLSYHFGLNKSLAHAAATATAAGNGATAAVALRGAATRRLPSLENSVEEPLYHLKDGVVYRSRLSEIDGKIEVFTKHGQWKNTRSLHSDISGLESAFHFYTNPDSTAPSHRTPPGSKKHGAHALPAESLFQ